ncbi:wax ester/triacylglycerol synthase family O-acyltransferase [Usitatibacter palustris]|uniref:diacylglycerol O-acyltransferase n=1 Tax=Usitatibacter palustris TaxID=2732487 RepID=A0A6M4H8L7_9PROT|nr:wax ester/triacylglycerol synthase family O-acyltransferase [Usitatibacter palustris]QJR14347.1 Putative diacylglycerol O-acyltransferase [Usitatibacter palustris]
MKHLSALDALFLQLETPATPMHVGSLMLLEKRPFKAFRDHIAARLDLAPIFTHKLGFMPLDLANPVWLRAGRVDLERHIRRLVLPKPGTRAQLDAAVARLHEGLLDRDYPLWEFTVIEGLKTGEVGIYAKLHHAALDGQGGIAVAQALLDTQARPPKRTGAGAEPAKTYLPPSTAKMLGAALRNTVAQYGRIVKALPETLKAMGRAGAVAVTAPKVKGASAPRTPLNGEIGAGRAFVSANVPLAEAKEIARRFDVKLNDVVLATCAGALRETFPAKQPMVGAVPASLRAPGDTTRANEVTMMLVGLATNISNPAKRLAAIHAAAGRAKKLTGSARGAIPMDLPSLGVPWLMALASGLHRKVVATGRGPVIANVVISNVPGPQMPLYMAGARATAYYPVSIVTHGLGLNITIISYDGSLGYGLVACKDTMPGLRAFAKRLQDSHTELLKLARRK